MAANPDLYESQKAANNVATRMAEVPKAAAGNSNELLVRNYEDFYGRTGLATLLITAILGIFTAALAEGLGMPRATALYVMPLYVICTYLVALFGTDVGKAVRGYRDIRKKIGAHDKRCQAFNRQLQAIQKYAALPGATEPPVEMAWLFQRTCQELTAVSCELDRARWQRHKELVFAEMTRSLEPTARKRHAPETRVLVAQAYADDERQRNAEKTLGAACKDTTEQLDRLIALCQQNASQLGTASDEP